MARTIEYTSSDSTLNQLKFTGKGYLDPKMQPVNNVSDLNDIPRSQRFIGLTVTVLSGDTGEPTDYILKTGTSNSSWEVKTTKLDSVNGISGTSTDGKVAITITSKDIELGEGISGQTATTKISATLLDIYQKIQSAATTAAITSTGKTITVSDNNGETNVEVTLEEATDDTVNAGHIEIKKNNNGGLYGLMYFGGDDVETVSAS